MKTLIWIAAIGSIVVGAIVANVRWPHMLPNGRWEFAIGSGERTGEVIALEDQHGDEYDETDEETEVPTVRP